MFEQCTVQDLCREIVSGSPGLRDGEVTQRVKVLASKPIDLSSVPRSHRWRKKTNSHKLSSDLRTVLALWSAHDYVCVLRTRACTHTYTQKANKRIYSV